MTLSFGPFTKFFMHPLFHSLQNRKAYLLKGTFLLGAAGILCKIAGFFYKIFLSRSRSVRRRSVCFTSVCRCVPYASHFPAAVLQPFFPALPRSTRHKKSPKKSSAFSLLPCLARCCFLFSVHSSFIIMPPFSHSAF